jgi:hypothetical protein
MNVKNGVKTTEFWIVLLANLSAIAGVIANLLPGEWAAVVVAIADAAYAANRALVKSNAVKSENAADLRAAVLDALTHPAVNEQLARSTQVANDLRARGVVGTRAGGSGAVFTGPERRVPQPPAGPPTPAAG